MKCSRKACSNQANPELIHRDLQQPYCNKCAKKINEFAGIDLIHQKWSQPNKSAV